MPLRDHFHPPLSERRSWEGFHGLWAAALVEKLNRDVLADEYFADMQVHVGGRIEVDVATPEESGGRTDAAPRRAPWRRRGRRPRRSWSSPPFPDDIEVQVVSTVAGAALVGAVELVSPGNKDRPEARRAFAAKCVSYLTQGVGLIVVDIVTNRTANLHNEVIGLMGRGDPFLLPAAATTYAVAYRPSRQPSGDQIELWPRPLALGQPLPVLPLALRKAGVVPVDLEAACGEEGERSRVG